MRIKTKKQRRKLKMNKRMEIVQKKTGIEEIVQVYNFLGTMIGFWVLLYPSPFKLVNTVSIIVSLIGFIIMFIFNKSVEFIAKDKSRPSVGGPILLNSVAIWAIGVFNSNTIYSSLFWTYFIICLITFVLLIAALKKFDFKNILSLVFLLISISAFSMGTITNTNYLYDNSIPTIYDTSVVKKDIYESGVRYHVKLHEVCVLPCGPLEKKTKVVVSQEFYDSVYENEKVQLCIQPGLFGINWYYLRT